MKYRYAKAALFAVSATALLAGTVSAQEYPARPIRSIVPFAAGASYDTIMRIVGESAGQSLGVPIVIENRPGASATIGADMLAKATPDGYTIGMLGNNHTILAAVGRKTPYDLFKDFAPLMRIANLDNVVVSHPSVPAKSLKELIALLKSQPGKFRYGSGGVGGSSHLAAALFANKAGANVQHVPYKGGGFAVTGLVAGEVQMMVVNMISAKQHIPSGRVRAYAVAATKRSKHLPDVPTTGEAGLPDVESSQWYGMFTPASTPKPILQRLEAELRKATAQAGVQQKLAAQGADAYAETPQQLAAFIRQDVKVNRDTARVAGIQVK